MTASQQDILNWLKIAKKNKSAFLIVGLDPFDHDNFPVYCATSDECNAQLNSLNRSGNSYDEVYDMSLSIDDQISERRSLHLPKKEKHD